MINQSKEERIKKIKELYPLENLLKSFYAHIIEINNVNEELEVWVNLKSEEIEEDKDNELEAYNMMVNIDFFKGRKIQIGTIFWLYITDQNHHIEFLEAIWTKEMIEENNKKAKELSDTFR